MGRFCILDNRQPMQVVQYNSNGTVHLRSITGDLFTKKDIPMYRIKMIERYGVSVYDLKNMPENLQKSSFSFEMRIKTSNTMFLTTLLKKIQESQIKAIHLARLEAADVMDSIATGKILCSIIEAANLRHSLAVKKHQNEIFHP